MSEGRKQEKCSNRGCPSGLLFRMDSSEELGRRPPEISMPWGAGYDPSQVLSLLFNEMSREGFFQELGSSLSVRIPSGFWQTLFRWAWDPLHGVLSQLVGTRPFVTPFFAVDRHERDVGQGDLQSLARCKHCAHKTKGPYTTRISASWNDTGFHILTAQIPMNFDTLIGWV